ncbi:unnamed protein product [Symbiodinium sp. CCMP2592]|nr:unnamed protein product [Symbiodinium sp. CCMP2592]
MVRREKVATSSGALSSKPSLSCFLSFFRLAPSISSFLAAWAGGITTRVARSTLLRSTGRRTVWRSRPGAGSLGSWKATFTKSRKNGHRESLSV